MSFYVYVLINLDKKPYYTYIGYTKDLTNRLKLHNNSKGAKFTRGKIWTLIYKKKYNNKSCAIKNEYKLKNNKKKRLEIKNNYLKKINYI